MLRITELSIDIEGEHFELVRALKKPGVDILASLTPEKCDIWHMATGAVTEAGELMDAVKRLVIYNKPADRENVIEELGDLEFYMRGIRQTFSISREETLTHNIAKLRKRYAELHYTDEAANARADKAE